MEQNDNMTESSDYQVDGGVVTLAMNAWYEWSRNNGITGSDIDMRKYELMREAFIDGYLNGFTKRITG